MDLVVAFQQNRQYERIAIGELQDDDIRHLLWIVDNLNATDSVYFHMRTEQFDLTVLGGHPERRVVCLCPDSECHDQRRGVLLDTAFGPEDGTIEIAVDGGSEVDTHLIHRTVSKTIARQVVETLLTSGDLPAGMTWLDNDTGTTWDTWISGQDTRTGFQPPESGAIDDLQLIVHTGSLWQLDEGDSSIHGLISFQTAHFAYPHSFWDDSVVRVLSRWIDALNHLRHSKNGQSTQFPFQWNRKVDVRLTEDGRCQLTFEIPIPGANQSVNGVTQRVTALIPYDSLLAQLTDAARRVVEKANAEDWHTDDLTTLKTLIVATNEER